MEYPMIDIKENRVKALLLARAEFFKNSPQAQASTHTAIWVEDGYIHYSATWSGQNPEGILDEGEIIQGCKLLGYNPRINGSDWTIAEGENAYFLFLEKFRKYPTGTINRAEEDYRDPDTGIRVSNGWLLT